MSIHHAPLRKILQFSYLPENKLTTKLRTDIRDQLDKENGVKSEGGGDFYSPFWSDAKQHFLGNADLVSLTEERIRKNGRRRRLYPLLTAGILNWWTEKRRWSNEDIKLLSMSAKGILPFEDLDASVKVDNILSLQIGEDSYRLIYPYFSETPEFTETMARLGLWVMSQSIPEYDVKDLRILDVMRGNSFSIADCPLQGDEEHIFCSNIKHLFKRWKDLRLEYD